MYRPCVGCCILWAALSGCLQLNLLPKNGAVWVECPEEEHCYSGNVLADILVWEEDSILLAGTNASFSDTASPAKPFLRMVDLEGQVLWSLDMPVDETAGWPRPAVGALARTVDEAILAVGATAETDVDVEGSIIPILTPFVIKLSGNGEEVWRREFDFPRTPPTVKPLNIMFATVATQDTGAFAVAGYDQYASPLVVVGCDAEGEVQWTYEGGRHYPDDLQPTIDGGYLLLSTLGQSSPGSASFTEKIVFTQLSATGAEVWEEEMSPPTDDYLRGEEKNLVKTANGWAMAITAPGRPAQALLIEVGQYGGLLRRVEISLPGRNSQVKDWDAIDDGYLLTVSHERTWDGDETGFSTIKLSSEWEVTGRRWYYKGLRPAETAVLANETLLITGTAFRAHTGFTSSNRLFLFPTRLPLDTIF